MRPPHSGGALALPMWCRYRVLTSIAFANFNPVASNDWFEAASRPIAVHPHWGPGALKLGTLLMLSPSKEVREEVMTLLRSQPQSEGMESVARMRELGMGLVLETAENWARLLGASPQEALQFCGPSAGSQELAGERAVERRLDRIWGGDPISSLQSLCAAEWSWPGPRVGYAILLHGSAGVGGAAWAPQTVAALQTGTVIRLEAGSVALIKEPPLATALAALAEIGVGFYDLLGTSGDAPVKTRLGIMRLEGNILRRGQNVIRLTSTEARALGRLAQCPGIVVNRQELSDAVQTNFRSLDRVILNLRNKLGDGLITTVYGVGYLLEPASQD